MMCPIACKKANPPATVVAFIDEVSASWNINRLDEWFIPIDVDVIRAISINTMAIDEFWAWQHERTGHFFVRSAYRMLSSVRKRRGSWLNEIASISDQKKEEHVWTVLWKVKVPSKNKVFLWHLARQSIPTNDVRHRRNMATD
jgi:hypothetical protein